MIAHENTADLAVTVQKPDRYFYLAWILWTTFCIPIAYLIITALLLLVGLVIGDTVVVNGVEHITEDYLVMYFLAPVMGLVTGAVQYGLLRRILACMGGWVLATAGGWLLGMFLIMAFLRLQWMVLAQTDLAFLVMGLSIGFAQWLVLRRRLPGAGWWIVASLLGWGLAALANSSNTINQYTMLLLGFLPGCATAAALAWLTKHLPPAEERTG
jgi:hypothetical protein